MNSYQIIQTALEVKTSKEDERSLKVLRQHSYFYHAFLRTRKHRQSQGIINAPLTR